jgi:aminoglycoside 6'-N-acetyltransferase I
MSIIRPVGESDAGEWLRMRRALWPDCNVAEHQEGIDRYFSGDRREPAEVLLAIAANGMTLGFVELSIRNIVDGCSSGNVAYLEGWYVADEARRLGVGRKLVEAAEQWARRQGCTEFGSDALIDNEVSRVAHVGLGFEETGRVRTFRKNIKGRYRRERPSLAEPQK